MSVNPDENDCVATESFAYLLLYAALQQILTCSKTRSSSSSGSRKLQETLRSKYSMLSGYPAESTVSVPFIICVLQV